MAEIPDRQVPRQQAAASLPAHDGFTWHPAPKAMALRGMAVMVLAEHDTLALVVDQEQWALVENSYLPMTSVGLTLVKNLQAR